MKAKDIEAYREELEYIMVVSAAGATDWRTLEKFNKDFSCFNRYVGMQADAAERDGFKGIAESMRALML
jgi:hypothetical protein